MTGPCFKIDVLRISKEIIPCWSEKNEAFCSKLRSQMNKPTFDVNMQQAMTEDMFHKGQIFPKYIMICTRNFLCICCTKLHDINTRKFLFQLLNEMWIIFKRPLLRLIILSLTAIPTRIIQRDISPEMQVIKEFAIRFIKTQMNRHVMNG